MDDAARAEPLDVIVVGAGPGGLYALHKFRERGYSVQGIERGEGPGGVWYWNRYPGARCDVESVQYQLGFSDELQRGWTWSQRFSPQPEILSYLNYVADTLDLRPLIRFGAMVTSASFDEASNLWTVRTDKGDRFVAKYVVLATGCLSSTQLPNFEGRDLFEGDWYHTGAWPHEPVDFKGKRVAVIGTGSSGVQLIPVVAEQAEQLYVFQRTPNFSMPARNRPLPADYAAEKKRSFMDDRKHAETLGNGTILKCDAPVGAELSDEHLEAELERRWADGDFGTLTFRDILTNRQTNQRVSEFVRKKIRGVVEDPEVAEALSPKDHPIGAKRPCLDTRYFETFNRPHVSLIDIRKTPIERITRKGVVCGGVEYEVDAIIYATGYDAMTGSVMRIDIRGRGGASLREKWRAGPLTYLGLGAAGFPNLFFIAGPGSPSVLVNMMIAVEQHVDWVADCIDYMESSGARAIEADAQAEAKWVEHVNAVASMLLVGEANSWYLGANIPGKTRIYMPYAGGFPAYRDRCEAVAAAGYEGFELTR